MQRLRLQAPPIAPPPPPPALRRTACSYRASVSFGSLRNSALPMPRASMQSTTRGPLYVVRGVPSAPKSGSSCPSTDAGESSAYGDIEPDQTTKFYEFVLPKLLDFRTHMGTVTYELVKHLKDKKQLKNKGGST